jgi:hypothetical protein
VSRQRALHLARRQIKLFGETSGIYPGLGKNGDINPLAVFIESEWLEHGRFQHDRYSPRAPSDLYHVKISEPKPS